MRPGNKANYECQKSDDSLHHWHINNAGAVCLNCRLHLNHDEAREVFCGSEELHVAVDDL